jgi:signal transduction histidine kinase
VKLHRLRTIQAKLFGVLLLATFVALVIALGAIVTFNARAYYDELVSDMTTQAELLGHMTAPALNFDDKKLADRNLSLLRFQPKVSAAAIYDAQGGVFATYLSPNEEPSIPRLARADVRTEGRYLILFKRIVSDGEIIGTVYLRVRSELAGKVLQMLGIGAFAMVVAMLIAALILGGLQKVITGPILAITGVARDVVEHHDYSRRAKKISDDEVGILVEAFNEMLTQIERAQQEIMRLNADLERKVHERTVQLEATNQDLLLAKAAAEQASAAKSIFLSSMSHELRTPLNAIIGFTGTLLMKLPGPLNADQEKQLSTVQLSAKHLLVLINDLLDLAKIEAGKVELSPEPTPCRPLLEDVMAPLRPLAERKGLELLMAAPAEEIVIRTDRRALAQIVLNLLNNAIKFTERGRVRLGIERRVLDGRSMVEFSVQDTGVGIRPEDQAKLFTAFTQVDAATRHQEGTGLGLYLSQNLAVLLGGTIICRSEYGKGSTFTLQLPQR